MELTLSQIKELAKDLETYNKGLKYYEDGCVVSLEIDQNFDPKNIFINATVNIDKKYYEINMAIDKELSEIQAAHCSCNHQPCEHLIALLCKLYFQQKKDDQPITYHDEQLEQCIKSYEQNIVYSTLAMSKENVRLIPYLELNKQQQPVLSFKIGKKKLKVLNSIPDFLKSMENNIVSDGEDEEQFIYNIHSFDSLSQKIYHFMVASQSQNQHFPNAKQLPLYKSQLDYFYDLFKNEGIELKQNRELIPLTFAQQDITFEIEINKLNEDTYQLRCLNDDFYFIEGIRHHYLIMNQHFYQFSEAYSSKMKNFIQYLYLTKKNALIPLTMMPAFYSNVLMSCSNYLMIQGDSIDEFAPLPLQAKLYLDLPHPNQCSAKLVFAYGDEEYPGFGSSRLSTYRNFAEEDAIRRIVAKYMTQIDHEQGMAYIAYSQDAFYQFFTEGIRECEQVATIYATNKIKKIQIHDKMSISMGVRIENDLLELQFSSDDFPIEELDKVLKAYRLNKKYVRLKSGSFVSIEDSVLSELSMVLADYHGPLSELSKGKITLEKYRCLSLDAHLKQTSLLKVERNLNYKTLVRNVNNIKDTEFEVPPQQKKILRNYQKVGYRWLKTMATYGFGGILADDMGIGKTIQIITLLQDEKNHHPDSTSLVICPSSLILNWEHEIHKFSPDLKCLLISGSAVHRSNAIVFAKQADVCITSYDYLKRDIELYQDIEFTYQILDEAQVIKNIATKNALSVKQIKSKHRFALTGTPIENSLSELWSIFDFLMSGYLFTYPQFKKSYEIPIIKFQDDGLMEQLKNSVEPFILRRLKKDVLKELPDKTETTYYVDMDEQMKELYLANVATIKQDLAKEKDNKIIMLSMLTRLRQICCDPRLVYENYDGDSLKMKACMELVQQCVESKKKVLIFSQFTTLLGLIEKALKKQNIAYYLLKGSTPKATRLQYVHAFNQDDTMVFLISLKAGGTGLNLTSSEVVIHFDPWWNVAAQNQATDRAYRLGQKNHVQVVKLIMKDTIEEKIMNLQELKKDLGDAIISENEGLITQLSPQQILDLF